MDTKHLSAHETEKLMHWLNGIAGHATSFVQAQAPKVVKEMIDFGLFSNGVAASLFLLFAVGAFLVAHKFARLPRIPESLDGEDDSVQSQNHRLEENFRQAAALVISSLIAIACSVFFFIFLFKVLFIVIAPRLYVLTQIRSLIS